ncbi:hypothetical protein L6R52_36895 [Myxococcota bacterium]|nr:hypothetical protein [Myxococcota bacterium]
MGSVSMRGASSALVVLVVLVVGLGASGLVRSPEARAADYHLGYRIGVAEGITASVSDQLVTSTTAAALGLGDATVRLEGLLFTTTLAGSLALDVLTPSLNHAAIASAAFSQTVPAAGARDTVSTFELGARYAGVRQRPTWGVALGGGWRFQSNGRLVEARDGSAPGTDGGDGLRPLSTFVAGGQIHTLDATTQLQLLREDWDGTFGLAWVFSHNGVFDLAPRPPGPQDSANRGPIIGPGANFARTNAGAFVRASTHVLTPSLSLRTRVGTSGVFIASAASTWTMPMQTWTSTIGRAGPIPVPKTLISVGALRYVRFVGRERQGQLGVQGSVTYGLRAPQDRATLLTVLDAPLERDSMITELAATWDAPLPWRVGMSMMVGAAQGWIFQPPLGTSRAVEDGAFETVRSAWEPIFGLTLSRTFEPVNANLAVTRRIGVGALGASAVVAEGASLTVGWQPRIYDRRAQLAAGVSVSRTRAVGRELFDVELTCRSLLDPTCPLGTVQLASDNHGFGANVSGALPVFSWGQFSGAATATYTGSWFDPDPSGYLRVNTGLAQEPFTTHMLLVTLDVSFGRGTPRELAPGEAEGRELSAFSADPATGSPLTSARLMRSGMLLDGTAGRRPGEAPMQDAGTRRAWMETQRALASDREARARAEAVRGSASIQEEGAEAEKKQAEERRAREEKRTRTFSEWPMDAKPLPEKEPSRAETDAKAREKKRDRKRGGGDEDEDDAPERKRGDEDDGDAEPDLDEDGDEPPDVPEPDR